MEQALRKYFWAFNLVGLALAMLLLARTANLFVESSLTSGIDLQQSATLRPPPAEAQVNLNGEKLAKITGLAPPVPEPTAAQTAAASAAALDPNAAPVKSDLRCKLLGTLLAGVPEWTVASIQDLTTLKPQDYRIGDKILGADVLDIERARVIVLNNGRREYISNDVADVPALPTAVAIRAPTDPNGGIRPTGENTYDISRSEIDKSLGDLNQMAMQARIVPAFKDGVAEGFKLFSIRPDSIYSKIGIVNGDVIKRINGFDLNSPEKALEIYSRLKESNRIDIELDRNGATVRKQYSVH